MMGLFKRLRVLEDDMYERKIREKLSEFEKIYGRKFNIRESYGGFAHNLLRLRMDFCDDICVVGFTHFPLKKVYKTLCESEDKIKIKLYNEILEKKAKENEDNDKE